MKRNLRWSMTDSSTASLTRAVEVRGLTVGGECPEPGPPPAVPVGGTAGVIPLKVGLTLASVWRANRNDYDHECLTQVQSQDATSVTVTESCPIGPDHQPETASRRLCRTDLGSAHVYHPMIQRGVSPISGANYFTLSRKSFSELKSNGSTPHRYVQLALTGHPATPLSVDHDIEGLLQFMAPNAHLPYRADLPDHLDIVVNGKLRSLPIVNADGQLKSSTDHGEVVAQILDDAEFPLMLSYEVLEDNYKVAFLKIDFPGELEHQLESEKHADVYGIYFDFASDRMRPESESVLREIGDVLAHNPGWTLRMSGHTDNIGGDAANLELSRKRSEAVRRALTQRFAVDPRRLDTAGYGSSQPKDTNETPEGRAHNRRVELVRTN